MSRHQRWTCFTLATSLVFFLSFLSAASLYPSTAQSHASPSVVVQGAINGSTTRSIQIWITFLHCTSFFLIFTKAVSTNLRRLTYQHLHPLASTSTRLGRRVVCIDHNDLHSFEFFRARHSSRRIHSTSVDKIVHSHLDDTLSVRKQYEAEILLQTKPNSHDI